MSDLTDKYINVVARLLSRTADGELQWRLVQNGTSPWSELYQAKFKSRVFTLMPLSKFFSNARGVAQALNNLRVLSEPLADPLPELERGRGLYQLTVKDETGDETSRIVFPSMRAVDDLGELVALRHSSALDELAELLK